jgi:hypothetical protein
MKIRRIAIMLAEIGEHRLENFGVNPGCGIVIEIYFMHW